MKDMIKKDIVKVNDLVIEDGTIYGSNRINTTNIELNCVSGIIDATSVIKTSNMNYENIDAKDATYRKKASFIMPANTKTKVLSVDIKEKSTVEENGKLCLRLSFSDNISIPSEVINFIYIVDNDTLYNGNFFTITESHLQTNMISNINQDVAKVIVVYSEIDNTYDYLKMFDKTIIINISNSDSVTIDSLLNISYSQNTDDYVDEYNNHGLVSEFKKTVTSTPSYTWKNYKTRDYDSSNILPYTLGTKGYGTMKYPTTMFPTSKMTLPTPTAAELYNDDMAYVYDSEVNNVEKYTANIYIDKFSLINGVVDFSYVTNVDVKHSFLYQPYKFNVVPHINLNYEDDSVTLNSISIYGTNFSLNDGNVNIDSSNVINISIIEKDGHISTRRGAIESSYDSNNTYVLNESSIKFYKNMVYATDESLKTDYVKADPAYASINTTIKNMFNTNKDKFINASAKLSRSNSDIYSNLVNTVNITTTILGKQINKKYSLPVYLPYILTNIVGL